MSLFPFFYLAHMNKRRVQFLPVLALAAILLLAPGPAPAADQAEPAPRAGRQAPLFELEDLSGRTVRLADLRGSVVLLNFWAVRCAPCAEEMPSLDRLHRALAPGGFSVVAVTIDRSAKLVQEFVREHRLAFPVLLDREQEVTFDSYAVVELPVSLLIDRSGRVVEVFQGPRAWDSAGTLQMIRQVMDRKEEGASR